jgi:hypothetical protein
MKRALALLVLLAGTLAAQSEGVMPVWEVRDAGIALEKHLQVVSGLLEQYHPDQWVAAGAPAIYVDQVKQARQYNTYVGQQAQALSREPEKLSVVLDVVFRLDHLNSLLESVTQGLRLHQNPGIADLMNAAISRNSTTREQLKQYAYQLTLDREKEWQIANSEAQRCRSAVSKQSPAPARKAPAATTPAPAQAPAAPPKP